MKVLVLGGCGYIGSATVAKLIANGHDVSVFDNLETGHIDAVPIDINVWAGDLRNYNDIYFAISYIKPEAIINFAAYAYVGESMSDPHKYYENNVGGAINLMRAIQNTNTVKKLVFSSTCATYGTPTSLPITEEMPQLPENPYGETKLAVEKMIKWYANVIPDFTYTFLRYFNAAGAIPELGLGERHDPETHIIPLILEAAYGKRQSIKVFGTDYDTPDGTCIRDYIHIEDLANAHVLAINENESDYYNLGTGNGYSITELLECVKHITNADINIEYVDRRPGDPGAIYADNTKACTKLGWNPIHSDIENIVRTAWEWHTEC